MYGYPGEKSFSATVLIATILIGLSAAMTSYPATSFGQGARAQFVPEFTIEEVLAAPFPYELVAAKRTDRIAWIEYEAGRRNVYTATGPEYRRERLTTNELDDGIDLEGLQISDDGSLNVYIRGHPPNRESWVASPTSNP